MSPRAPRNVRTLLPLLTLALAACKGEIKQITFIAPAGSVIEYKLEPGGPAGSLTMSTNQEIVAVNGEAEKLVVGVLHPEGALRGSPTLRAEIAQSASSGGFDPRVSKTHLTFNRASHPTDLSDVRCGNLVAASGFEGTVAVTLRPPLSIGDCEDKDLRMQDPLWAGKNRGVGSGFNYFSESDDRAMGLDFVRDFNTKNAHLLVKDHTVQPYLQNMMNEIAAKSDAPHVKPVVHFINADVVNAFALPGGPVYVFRGIMEYVRDEHELIGILGHEWAHVAGRHGTRNVSRAINGQLAVMTAAILAQLAIAKADEKDKVVTEIVANAAYLLAYGTSAAIVIGGGRDAEREADLLGAQYAYRVGFRPNGIADFFASLAKDSGGGRTWLESVLASHPDHNERVASNNGAVANYYPDDAMSLPSRRSDYNGVLLAMNDMPPMLRGEEANRVLALKFVKTNQDVAHKAFSDFFGEKFQTKK